MKRVCFRSSNLIGDALNISPALNAWYHLHEDWEIEMLTLPDHASMLYTRMGVPLKLRYKKEELTPPYDLDFTFDCGQSFAIGNTDKIHQTEAYAKMLGVKVLTKQPICIPTEDYKWMATQPENVILVSPFSRSCSSHSGQPANKMLPWDRWSHILRYLRSLDYPIRVLGGPDDRAEGLDVSEEEYLCGQDLNRVALIMRDRAVLMVSIDNGMGHLAASQSTPTFLFYPACLGVHWIIPEGNPNIAVLQVNPVAVQPVHIMWQMKQAVPKLLEVRGRK